MHIFSGFFPRNTVVSEIHDLHVLNEEDTDSPVDLRSFRGLMTNP